MLNLETINIIALAYLGDSVYEKYVRYFLLMQGIQKVDELQKNALNYVSAISQRRIVDKLISEGILNEAELEVFKRGRNYKRKMHPKHTDIITYKCSTGFEAVIGYLYLTDKNRLDEIMKIVLR